MRMRRKEARSLCSDLVKLEWKDDEGWLHELPGVLEDISGRGACVQVESPVPAETELLISQGDRWGMQCRVVYCEFHDIGYFLGLEFASGELWDQGVFRPRHLLDLNKLMATLNARAVR
jgi:hypothetical protein